MMEKSSYSSYFSSRGVDPSMYRNAQLPYYLKQIMLNKDISILEIGCGFGQLLTALHNDGFMNIQGIDISDEAIAFCRKHNLPVMQGDILNVKFESKYDFVIMSHVLEHMPKNMVIPVLSKIRMDILKDNGQLCIMVPNAQSNTDCYWAYEDFTHNTLFTAGSLLYVLREAGFSDIEFIDPDGLGWMNQNSLRYFIKKLLLKLYKSNKLFWNRITGSAYHQPSPIIFTYELKCLARK